MFVILGLASLLLGVGSHKMPSRNYIRTMKSADQFFKYSLTLFVREKGWILFVCSHFCSSQLLMYSTHSFNFAIYLLRNQWRSTICWVVSGYLFV
jgi:hypothetical protein